MNNVKRKIFDLAWEHAEKMEKMDMIVNFPVCKMGTGVWFGTVYAVIKVEPCKGWEDIDVDYTILEREFPFLKEKRGKVNMDKWFEPYESKKIEGNKIEFTEIIIKLNHNIGRVFKFENGQLGVISVDFDYLTYDLDRSFEYICTDPLSPVIGLKPGNGTIKQRAFVAIMPLRCERQEMQAIINKTKEEIEKITAEKPDNYSRPDNITFGE